MRPSFRLTVAGFTFCRTDRELVISGGCPRRGPARACPADHGRRSLLDYRATFSRPSNRITLTGKLVADIPAHSVIVIDDQGQSDEYWNVGYAARIAKDGTFRLSIDHPVRADGHLRAFSASTTELSAVTARGSSGTTVAKSRKVIAFATGRTGSAGNSARESFGRRCRPLRWHGSGESSPIR